MTQSALPGTVATSDRVLHVLAVLAQQGRAMSAAELMEHTGMARSTLYRQLARLKRWGFVLESDGGYAPGPLSLQLALGFDLASHLVRQARPGMVELSQQSQESVGLIVAVNDQAICLDMVESHHSLRCSFEKGRSVPLRAGASAKCVLAHLPTTARDAVLTGQWGAGTPEREAAHQELEAIRQAGFATSESEVDPGVWGCSVPLFGASRQAAGAITLMAPNVRAQGQEAALIRMVVVAAIDCIPLGGASTDFNLMLRHGRWQGAVQVLQNACVPGSTPAGLCMVLSGRWQWGGETMEAGEGLWWSTAAPPSAHAALQPLASSADTPAIAWVALVPGFQPNRPLAQ